MELFVEALDKRGRRAAPQRHPPALHRRPGTDSAPGIAAERIAAAEARTARQSPPDADHRRQLRRPLGHRRRRRGSAGARARSPARSARRRSTRQRSAASLQLGRRARPGPVHPHRRRAAHQQFPAVAPRLHANSISATRCWPDFDGC
ncbi:MAG: hypothetical protein MZV65_53435 [Chromatiales bacterium]|nr:hypothetical protein [Chromatiales bacterium]